MTIMSAVSLGTLAAAALLAGDRSPSGGDAGFWRRLAAVLAIVCALFGLFIMVVFFIDRNDMLYAADHQSDAKTNPGFRKGITIGSARDGKVSAFIPDPDGEAGSQEGVAVDVNGTIYGSLTGGMALRKYVKQ